MYNEYTGYEFGILLKRTLYNYVNSVKSLKSKYLVRELKK